MSEIYTEYSRFKERQEAWLSAAGEKIAELNGIVNRVVTGYVEGCRANGVVPAKYMVQLEKDIETVSGQLIDQLNKLDGNFFDVLLGYVKSMQMLQQLPIPGNKKLEGFYATGILDADTAYITVSAKIYANTATVQEADAAMKAAEELIPMFFPRSKYAYTYKTSRHAN